MDCLGSPTTNSAPGRSGTFRQSGASAPRLVTRRRGAVLGEPEHDLGLNGIGVLELVDQEMPVLLLQRPPHLFVLTQDARGQVQQVAVVQAVETTTLGRGGLARPRQQRSPTADTRTGATAPDTARRRLRGSPRAGPRSGRAGASSRQRSPPTTSGRSSTRSPRCPAARRATDGRSSAILRDTQPPSEVAAPPSGSRRSCPGRCWPAGASAAPSRTSRAPSTPAPDRDSSASPGGNSTSSLTQTVANAESRSFGRTSAAIKAIMSGSPRRGRS